MAKPTTIKDALKLWEEAHEGESVTEATDVQLQFQWPPIEKMDATLSTLVNCEKLSLSTNMIEKIVGLASLTNLKILSLARNNIKSLAGIEVLGDNLEQLWISYNQIDKLKGIETLKKLQVFYVSNNLIKDFTEINKLASLPKLADLLFVGNPAMEDMDNANYRRDVCRRLQLLKILDGVPIVRDV